VALLVWEGEGRRVKLHGGPKLTAAQWGGGGALARARRPGRHFYSQIEKRGGGTAEQGLIWELLRGEKTWRTRRAAATPAAARQCRRRRGARAGRQLLYAQARRIFSARVLESKVVVLLDWLDSAFEGEHDGRAGHSHQLMSFYGF
jgi:hypothetical protein